MSGGTRSYEMARRLVAAGHEVHIVTSDRSPHASSDWYVTCEAGIVVHWLPVPYSNRMSYKQRLQAFFRFALNAAQRATTIPADLVFATSTPLTIALPAVYAARRQNIPMVLEVRDVWPEVPIALGALKGPMIPLAQQLERFAYRKAVHIVTLSPDMKRSIVANGVSEDKVHIIPNGCDLDMFSVSVSVGLAFRDQYQWLKNRPLIVYTGTLGLVNGVDYFARIAAHLAEIDSSICCLVVGEGQQEDRVRSAAHQLGVLNRNFFMLASIAKQQVPGLLSSADIATSFVIDVPALWANSANKFFDALAAGRPVAINYRGWQAELLEQTGAGIVLPPNDARLAAQQLWALLQAKDRLAHARVAARHLAEQRFDRDKLARQLEEVLKLALVTR